VAGSWGTIGRVARDRRLRRIELGFAAFAVAEHGTWLAGIMYAYERGGVDEAGVVAVVLLVPGLFIAPIAAIATDRHDGGRVLAAGYGIQAVSMSLVAIAISADAGAIPVYAAAMVAASGVIVTRPAMAVALPNATRTPADLTAANVVTGFVEHSGMFVGPALTGILVGLVGLAAPFAVCAGLTAVAAVLASDLQLDTGRRAAPAPVDGDVGGALGDTLDGVRALRRHRAVRTTIGMLTLASLVGGASDVLVVATADELTAGETSRAGLFGTAYGLGAIVGSLLTVTLVGRTRLTPPIALGVAAMGGALAALAAPGTWVVAAGLFGLMGVGESIARVAATTLIQRISPLEVIGRFFGVAESLQLAGLAVGSGAIGLLIGRLGYASALLLAGATVPLLLLLRLGALLRIDRDAVAPDERVLELILGDDIFAALPAPTVERLAADAERCIAPAGATIVAEADVGDRYYVVDSGTVAVSIAGRHVRDVTPGGGFGELALLADIPRTATVAATTDVELLAFEREPFLQAVTGHHRSEAVASERTSRFLGPSS
jgi:MFS family permease